MDITANDFLKSKGISPTEVIEMDSNGWTILVSDLIEEYHKAKLKTLHTADVSHNASSVLDVIKNIPQQGQVQYDLHRQLQELRVAANKLGLYDAADFIRPHCD